MARYGVRCDPEYSPDGAGAIVLVSADSMSDTEGFAAPACARTAYGGTTAFQQQSHTVARMAPESPDGEMNGNMNGNVNGNVAEPRSQGSQGAPAAIVKREEGGAAAWSSDGKRHRMLTNGTSSLSHGKVRAHAARATAAEGNHAPNAGGAESPTGDHAADEHKPSPVVTRRSMLTSGAPAAGDDGSAAVIPSRGSLDEYLSNGVAQGGAPIASLPAAGAPAAAGASAAGSLLSNIAGVIVNRAGVTRRQTRGSKASVAGGPVVGTYVVIDEVDMERTKEAIVEVAAIESAYTDEAFVEVAVIDAEESKREQMLVDGSDILASQIARQDVELYVEEAEKYSMWSVNPKTGDHEFDPGPLAVDFYCNVCQRSLPLGTFRIRCVECVDFDLCIACACKGAVRNEHRSDHKYIPISPNSFNLFGDWTADEELLLLEGISKFGFGNWNQVAEMVNRLSTKNKSATECEHHYNEFYIHSQYSPFPDIRRMRPPVKNQMAKDHLYTFFQHVQQTHRKDKPRTAGGDCPTDERAHHIDLIPPAVNMLGHTGSRLKFFQNFNGYNIYRDELETEFNNDAEMIIKDLEFDPWDTPAEVEFKLRLVEIYNSMLDDRIRHKRLLIHRFWNDYPTRERGFQSMNQIEKAAYWRLSPLMRLHSEEDHLRLTKLIVAKIEIEKRLRLVSTWSSLGLRTIEDIENFEVQKLPSAHAAGCNEEMHPISQSLLARGSIGEAELNDLTEQLTSKFCNDFSITKMQVDTMFSEICKLNDGAPIANTSPGGVVPSWDICFKNDVKLDENELPPQAPVLELEVLPEKHWHPRLVLDAHGPCECPAVDFGDVNFTEPSTSVVQQSQAFAGRGACVYVAKFVPQLKSRVRKNAPKRKRHLQLSDYSKRGNTRKV